MSHTQEIRALTGLRFAAAFYIFVFHMHTQWPVTEMSFVKNILDKGDVSMNLFFILSGFVLAYRYADGRTSITTYLVNRWARIYPLYVTAAVLTIPWMGLTWVDDSPLNMIKTFGQGGLLVLSNIFLIQAWFPQFFNYWNNGGSWSVSVEVFCYALLPLLLPRLVGLSRHRLVSIAWLSYGCAVLPGLIEFFFPSVLRTVYYALPIYRFPAFMLGVCSYLIVRNGGGDGLRKGQAFLLPLVLFLTLTYCGLLGDTIPQTIEHNWIMVPVMTYVIVTLASGKGVWAACLSHPLCVWLGKISYGFYLFQELILLSLSTSYDSLLKMAPILANNEILLLAALSTLIALSAAGYYGIEEPLRQKIRKAYGSDVSHVTL